MVQHDEDAVALLTVCWSLAKAHFPSDVMGYIEKCLEDSGILRLATRNVSEGLWIHGHSYENLLIFFLPLGQGYRLEINGKIYQFPAVTRAPPEGYMSQDYVAYVSIPRKSLFALNFKLFFLAGHTLTSVGLNMRFHGVSTELSRNKVPITAASLVLTALLRIKMHGQVVVEETLWTSCCGSW